MDLLTIFSVILAAAIPLGGLLLGKRFSGEESDEYITQLREEARILENKIIDILSAETAIASKTELTSLKGKASEYASAVESQKLIRSGLEVKLSSAHSDVISRETAQQDMKAEKQEDEVTLQSLIANYKDISTESVSLEKRLADSLRTIDKMSSEVAMSDDQKAVLEALSAALTNASTQLRDVIVAHQNVHERLEALQAQYTNLEGEYIKLIELQLEG